MTTLCAIFACLIMSVSAYSDVGPTRWGGNVLTARHGVAACGPSWRPGTVIYVPGAGMRVCMDTGGLVTDRHVDLWVANEEDAWTWGRQTLTVAVLR